MTAIKTALDEHEEGAVWKIRFEDEGLKLYPASGGMNVLPSKAAIRDLLD